MPSSGRDRRHGPDACPQHVWSHATLPDSTAVVLAQRAARHYLRPGAGLGVNDVDVWSFYARRHGSSLHPGRYEVQVDFGPSTLGRNQYPTPMTSRERTWNDYAGRRVDFVREPDVPLGAGIDDVIGALRRWLHERARERCRHPEGRNSSAHQLAHKAVVWIGTQATRDHAGGPVWDEDADPTTPR